MNLQKLVKKIATQLVNNGQTLCFAESCTGGQASSAVTSRSGSSKYFSGAVVCYANRIKHDLLGVSEGVLNKNGAVSKPVALAMAKGAKNTLKTHWAVSITGIAGPTGGTQKKPVGLVHFAVVGPKLVRSNHKIFKGTRSQIQKQAVEFALQMLLKNLNP